MKSGRTEIAWRISNVRDRGRLLVVVLSATAIAFLFASFGLQVVAQEHPIAPAGDWRGAIDLSVGEMVLDVTMRREAGAWIGIVNIPEQDIADAPMQNLEVTEDLLSFEIYTSFGPYRFRGMLDRTKNEIRGSVSSGQYSRPFGLASRDAVREVRVPELTPKKVDGIPSERSAAASPEHPSIEYATRAPSDAIARLNARLNAATSTLRFEAGNGYLGSVLGALKVSSDSQIVVFSKTSVQAPRISPANPRALYFGDDVVVGFIRGAPFIEVAALDPKQGVVFYSLDQRDTPTPRFARRVTCLGCHLSHNTMDVPGFLVRSVAADSKGRAHDQFGSFNPDHRTPFAQRWGGWYVTGAAPIKHLGNTTLDPEAPEKFFDHDPKAIAELHAVFDTGGYAAGHSDMVALLVFEHQMHMANLIVRMGWDARAALSAVGDAKAKAELTKRLLANDARELVDYMLFVDEAPLGGAIKTNSEFASSFAAAGRRDAKGRSLRDLDLTTRLLRYPCSYMIYSEAFDALPSEARDAIYERMWQVLSGAARERSYERLSRSDRRNIVEILRATKPGLPSYFRL